MIPSITTCGWQALRLVVCLASLALVRSSNMTDNTCSNLLFEGLKKGHSYVKVNVDEIINVTGTFSCQVHNMSYIKVSREDSGFTVDVCKLLLSPTCSVSDSSPCRCLSNYSFQFLKRVSRSDNGTYIWRWRGSGMLGFEKRENFTIFVTELDRKSGSPVKFLLIVCGICMCVIVAPLGAFIVGRRRASRHHTEVPLSAQHTCSSEADMESDVREATVSQPDDSMYDHLGSF